MKIEIDLNDILGDESGAESLQESIHRQVIDSVTALVKKGVGDKIDRAVSETISLGIKEFIDGKMPELCAEIMEAEYTPVGTYGDRSNPTTFRKELLKSITANMVYKKTNYSSERSAFTAAVDAVIEEHVKTFQTAFKKEVDSQYTAAAMQFATDTLKKKLGIV